MTLSHPESEVQGVVACVPCAPPHRPTSDGVDAVPFRELGPSGILDIVGLIAEFDDRHGAHRYGASAPAVRAKARAAVPAAVASTTVACSARTRRAVLAGSAVDRRDALALSSAS